MGETETKNEGHPNPKAPSVPTRTWSSGYAEPITSPAISEGGPDGRGHQPPRDPALHLLACPSPMTKNVSVLLLCVPPVLSHRLEFYILLIYDSRIVFNQMQLNSMDVPGLF